MTAATGVVTRSLLDWAVVEPTKGSFTWPDRAVGALASQGVRLVPYRGGLLRGWPHPRAPARQRVRRTGVAGLPPGGGGARGPGGSYWANDYEQQFGRAPPSRSGPGRSERAHLEKYSRQAIGRGAPTSSRSPRHHQEHDPQARIVLAGMPGFGAEGLGLHGQPLRDTRIQRQLRRRRSASLRPTVEELGTEIEKFRASMTRNGDGSKPLWLTSSPGDPQRRTSSSSTRARPVRRIIGGAPSGPSCANRSSGTCGGVLVRLARSGPGVRGREGLQLLRQRGPELPGRAQALLPEFQRLRSQRVKPRLPPGIPHETSTLPRSGQIQGV